MTDLLVVAGAPGSGKTTICRLLYAELGSAFIDFGHIRQFHLDNEWSNASEREESMAFENLLSIVRNYFRHSYAPVIVTDLQDFRVQEIPIHFRHNDFVIATLVVNDDAELKRRVLIPERDSGYRDYASSIAWNRGIIERPAVQNEVKIDNTSADPARAVGRIRALIGEDQIAVVSVQPPHPSPL
ncbi:MAG: AAA family ATPase [Caldilineaceae bacterium]|nr:AAA family ATPase [Caldilineaceae bacterium]